MAETAPVVKEQQPSQQAPVVDIQALERMAFGGDGGQPTNGVVNQNGSDAPAVTLPQQEPAASPSVDYLKELGYESVDAAKADIEALRQLKATPPTPAEIEFANDQSKKIYSLLKEGKTKEVYSFLDAQEKMASLESLDSDGKLKLYYKMQYGFDEDLIDLKMKKEYGFDETPFKDEVDGTITDPNGYRLAKAEATFKKNQDLEKATAFFEQYKQKVELPDIEAPVAAVDKDYEAYKASNANAEKFYNETAPLITALKVEDVPLTFSINDENNKMKFDVSIVPDETAFNQAKQDSLAWDVFKGCYDKSGKFIPQNLQRLSLFANNLDNYVQAIARQAVNAERKRVIEETTPDTGARRNFQTQVEPTELQKFEKMAFG